LRFELPAYIIWVPGDRGLHVVWKVEECFGGAKQGFDLVGGDVIVDDGKETNILGSIDKLGGDFIDAILIVYERYLS
jgi:hypothetical protein